MIWPLYAVMLLIGWNNNGGKFIAMRRNTGPMRWRQISARLKLSGEAPTSNVPPQMNCTGLPKLGSVSRPPTVPWAGL